MTVKDNVKCADQKILIRSEKILQVIPTLSMPMKKHPKIYPGEKDLVENLCMKMVEDFMKEKFYSIR